MQPEGKFNLHEDRLMQDAATAITEDYANHFDNFMEGNTIEYDRKELDKRLRRHINRLRRRPVTVAFLRGAIASFAISIFTFSVLFLTVEAFQVKVRNLFYRESQTHIDIGEEYSVDFFLTKGLAFNPILPEGYSIRGGGGNYNNFMILYGNGEESVAFTQSNKSNFSFDNEVDDYEAIYINDIEGYLSYKENDQTYEHGVYLLIWIQDDYFLSLQGADRDLLLWIAENLEKID